MMKKDFLKSLFKKITIGKREGLFIEKNILSVFIMNIFLYILIAISVYYSIFYSTQNLTDASFTILLFSFVFVILLILSLLNKKPTLIAHLVVITTTLLFIVVVGFVEVDESNLFWYFLYPFVPYFLRGRKIGAIYTAIIYLFVIIIMFFPPQGYYTYDTDLKKVFFIAFTTELVLLSLFDFIRTTLYNTLLTNTSKEIDLLTEVITQKDKIASQVNEIYIQNKKLQEQNTAIKESIDYALFIQASIFPDIDEIRKKFDAFVLYKPKDIVSGDFFWHFDFGRYTFLAVVDCTGHGVPGAFLSLIGINFLNEIVNQTILDPIEILEELDDKISASLKQDAFGIHDGMDVCLVRILDQKEEYNVVFSGAKRPLLYYNSKEKKIERIKGSRRPIGGAIKAFKQHEFIKTEFTAYQGDVLYLTSDGYVDQHNIDRKRIGSRIFLSILEGIATNTSYEQIEVLSNFLMEWQSVEQQTDDITILGLKLLAKKNEN